MSVPTQQTIPYADHFDQWASYYDSTPELHAITDTVRLADKTVVETDCGTGRLSYPLAPDTNEYIALDEDSRLVTKATEKHKHYATPLSFTVAQQNYIPIKDNTADILLSAWSTDHTIIGHTLTEYERVLKPDGSLILIEEAWTDPDTTSDYASILTKIHPGHTFYNQKHSVTDIITDAYQPPINSCTIRSKYTYPSYQAAESAFTFHITGNKTDALHPEQQTQLQNLLMQIEQPDGTIELSERATLSQFTLNQ